MRFSRSIFYAVIFGLVAACDSGSGFIAEPVITKNPNPRVPLAAVLTYDAGAPATTRVDVTSGDEAWTIEFDEDATAGLPLVGLKPARSYDFNVTATLEDGTSLIAERLSYRTPPLPPGLGDFPPIKVNVAKPSEMEPGVTFLSVRRRVPGRPHWLTPAQRRYSTEWGVIVAVDPEGDVIWYYESDRRVAGIDRLSNGNLLFHLTDARSQELDLLGNTVTEWYAADRPHGPPENPDAVPIRNAQTIHHQPLETPMGTFLSFSANARLIENYYTDEYDPDAPREDALVMGDDVIEFDREGNELWRWSTWDHLDPFRIGYELTEAYWHVRGFPDHLDWTHGNGLEYDPRDDSIIINLRHQDALIKIDRESGEIVWILGEHTDWSEELQKKLLKPVGEPFRWIYHAHNPRLTESGTIVLFDNGKFQARPFRPYAEPEGTYSRTVEFEVDEEAMTVRQLWASHDRVTPDNCYSFAMGDAHWLPKTGNFLVVDSICDYRQEGLTQNEFDYSKRHIIDVFSWARVREYGGRDSNNVVFELEVRDTTEVLQWQIFGGFRTPSIYHTPEANN
jgi:arylsulfate sulfotransferase